jgi:WD40 repeat protein
MAQETGERRESTAPSLAEMRAQLELLARELDREGHILQREPEVLASHLHNMLYLDEGEEGPAGPLLGRARKALAGRPWLRLTNRPPVERSGLLRALAHPGTVWGIAWSPDGRTLASGGDDGSVRVWKAETGQPTAILVAYAGEVNALSWSPDGGTLASGHNDGTVRLWDPTASKQRAILEGHTDGVLALAWSPDGGSLASASADQTVRLWDRATERSRAVLAGHTGRVYALAWAPDAVFLASGSGDGTVRLWDPVAGSERGVLQDRALEECVQKIAHDLLTFERPVWALDWSPDGAPLLSGGRAGWLAEWDLATGELKYRYFAHDRGVCALAWSPDGLLFASAGGDNSIELWAPATRQKTGLRAGHSDVVRALSWSPNGAILASGGEDGTVRLWEAQTLWDRVGRPDVRIVPEGHSGPVFAVAWSRDGSVLASGGADQTVRLWDAATGAFRILMQEAPGPVFALASSGDGVLMAPGYLSSETTVWVYDLARGALRPVAEKVPPATALAVSSDGVLHASGDLAGTVWVWEAATGGLAAVFLRDAETKGPIETKRVATPVWALAWSPDRALLAAASDTSTVLWDLATHKQRAVLEGRPEGEGLGSTAPSEAERAEELGPSILEVVQNRYGLAWSPDGALLASAGWDNTGRLWDWARGMLARVLEGHTRPAWALAWSPDSALLASGSEDHAVRLWDPASGECLSVVHCLSPVLALQFSADGCILGAADSGASTGNRPIPYLFELCNIEIGPPLAPAAPLRSGPAKRPAAAAGWRPSSTHRAGAPERLASQRAPQEPPGWLPRKEEAVPLTPSLVELLKKTGLHYQELRGGILAVPLESERAANLVVQANRADDEMARLSVELPKPGRFSEEAGLRNLLRVTFRANYVKAMVLQSGDLALAAELPYELLTTEVVEGLIRGLAQLGDVKGGDLSDWKGWERRLAECALAQSTLIKVDIQQAEATFPSLARVLKLPCRQVQSAADFPPQVAAGIFVVDISGSEVTGFGYRFTLPKAELVIRVLGPAISCVARPGMGPKGDKKKYMRRLLELNQAVKIAKVGLDGDDKVVLLYEVPEVVPDMLKNAIGQLGGLLAGVAALETRD